jgi:hypothetical protein
MTPGYVELPKRAVTRLLGIQGQDFLETLRTYLDTVADELQCNWEWRLIIDSLRGILTTVMIKDGKAGICPGIMEVGRPVFHV